MNPDPMQAYHRGMFGKNYVFLTIGGFDTGWWKISSNSSCTPEFLHDVIVNGFDFIPEGYQLKSDESGFAISGLVSLLLVCLTHYKVTLKIK